MFLTALAIFVAVTGILCFGIGKVINAGMKKEDVHVTMEENDLVLFGERKEETETNKDNYYRAECSYGSFYRRLPLAFEADFGKIAAKFTDGVLEIHVPIPAVEPSKPQEIALN